MTSLPFTAFHVRTEPRYREIAFSTGELTKPNSHTHHKADGYLVSTLIFALSAKDLRHAFGGEHGMRCATTIREIVPYLFEL